MNRQGNAPACADWPCLSMHGDALWLAVSVSPNARRTQVEGLHDGALRVRLAAPPVDGKANDLLVAWIAVELGLPRSAVRVVRGQASRRKWLAIDTSPAGLAQWLQACLGGSEPPSPSPA